MQCFLCKNMWMKLRLHDFEYLTRKQLWFLCKIFIMLLVQCWSVCTVCVQLINVTCVVC